MTTTHRRRETSSHSVQKISSAACQSAKQNLRGFSLYDGFQRSNREMNNVRGVSFGAAELKKAAAEPC